MARSAYVHEVVLTLDPSDDQRRPGAVVTVELCGHWEHEGPCRWPHHTAVAASGGALVVRTVFAAEPPERDALLTRIASALRASSGWHVLRTGAADPTDEERARASRWFTMPSSDTA
jgi:hypothetical protein